jgi:16S rRNA (guanine966-N2)-methyltransferase
MNKPNNSRGSGTIRIIGGIHKGRKLPVLDSEGLRPTTDRVKETLFNWLMFSVRNAKCLDLFAGSGSLGFEALSRQAESVTMIEKEKKVFQNLQKCADILKENNLKLINGDALSFLKNTTDSYNIVFLDPPFRKDFLNEIFNLLTPSIVPNNAFVYVEQEAENITEAPKSFKLIKEGKAGQVIYRLYQLDWT